MRSPLQRLGAFNSSENPIHLPKARLYKQDSWADRAAPTGSDLMWIDAFSILQSTNEELCSSGFQAEAAAAAAGTASEELRTDTARKTTTPTSGVRMIFPIDHIKAP